MEDFNLNTNETINIENKITEWIERGEKIIYPENYKDWTNCVKNRAKDAYHGADLECALEVMEALENDANLDELEEKLNRANFSESAHYLILRIILAFSKYGPELMEYITHGDIPDDLKQAIDNQRQENEKLEELNKVENVSVQSMTIDETPEFEPMDVNVSLQVVKKQSIWTRIINFFKKLFTPKTKLLGSNENNLD